MAQRQQIHLLHTYDVAHLLPIKYPQLTTLYYKNFLNTAKQQKVQANTDAHCIECGSLLMMGHTLKVRVQEGKVKHECLRCGSTREEELPKPQEPKEPKEFVAEWNGKRPAENKAKNRAKKRKVNSLGSLLQQKKDKEQADKQKNSSLSLMDFMKM